MTTDLIERDRLVSHLGASSHLAECRHQHLQWPGCDWCAWALSTPDVETLLAVHSDARLLTGDDRSDTVAWVVAATELCRRFDSLDLTTLNVPSAREIVSRFGGVVGRRMAELRARLDSSVGVGGPVESHCLHTGGALTAAAVQDPSHADLRRRLPQAVRTALDKLTSSLSAGVQISSVLPLLEHHHWRGLPVLETQPEWQRMKAPGDPGRLRDRQMAATGAAPGSLEALVIESLLDRVSSELLDLADSMRTDIPPVELRRSIDEPVHSSQTRAMLWRIAKLDWHLTFLDTGAAACWNARIDGLHMTAEVPWHVAMAIRAAAVHDLVSAVRRGVPDRVST